MIINKRGYLSLNSLDKKLYLITDDSKISNLMLSEYPARFIPEYNANESEEVKDNYWVLEYYHGKFRQTIDEKNKRMNVTVSDYSYGELSFLVLQLFEKLFEKEEKYIVHASAVSDDNGANLIIGNSGSGKTTLSFTLYNKGYKFISNEHTIIDPKNRRIIGGTKVITFKEFQKEYITDKLIEFPTDDNHKIYLFDLSDKPNVIQQDKIKMITMPIIYPHETKEAKVLKASEFAVRDNLIELPNGLMRGSYVYLNKFRFLGKNIDNLTLSNKRMTNIFYNFPYEIPKYVVIGGLEAVTEEVESIMDGAVDD